MMNSTTRGNRGKRSHDDRSRRQDNDDGDDDEEGAVDDLAVASMFASVATASASPTLLAHSKQVKEHYDDEENDDDDDDGDDTDTSNESEDESDEESNDTDSDDDSQVDTTGDGDKDEIALDGGDGDDATMIKQEITEDVTKETTPISTTPTAIDDAENDDDEDDDDDDVSDIDLTEHLANMVDDDECEDNDGTTTTRKRGGKCSGGRDQPNNKRTHSDAGAPRTENEIDPYRCPTEQLQKLNVLDDIVDATLTSSSLSAAKTTALKLDNSLKSKLRIAGTVRSYLACQRTVVIDSFIPPSLSTTINGNAGNTPCRYSFHGASVSQPLDIGSMLVVITKEHHHDGGSNRDGKCAAIAMNEIDDNDQNGDTKNTNPQYTVQILGKIMEIFGPVQRPFYAIRLPDPPTASKIVKEVPADDKRNEKQQQFDATDNINTINLDQNSSPSEEATTDGVGAAEQANESGVIDATVDAEIVASTNSKSNSAHDEENEANQHAPENDAGEEVNDESNSSTQSKIEITETSVQRIDDPWFANGGKLSTMLLASPHAAVYSLSDYSKLVDTANVIRVSGKGCDASNMYDEEVGMDEQQYSDDEQEREARSRGRGGATRKKEVNDDGRSSTFVEGRGTGRGGGRGRGGGSGRGSGRDGRGGGRGRGGHSHHHGNTGSFGPTTHPVQQPSHQQPYPPSHQQSHFNNNYPPQQQGNMQAMMGYAHGQSSLYQQGMYQQQHLQPQYSQQQFQHQLQPGGFYQYPPTHGQTNMMYGAPPPPPPPPPPRSGSSTTNAPLPYYYSQSAQQAYQQSAQPPPPQPQHGTAESDTVYYDYSG